MSLQFCEWKLGRTRAQHLFLSARDNPARVTLAQHAENTVFVGLRFPSGTFLEIKTDTKESIDDMQ